MANSNEKPLFENGKSLLGDTGNSLGHFQIIHDFQIIFNTLCQFKFILIHLNHSKKEKKKVFMYVMSGFKVFLNVIFSWLKVAFLILKTK